MQPEGMAAAGISFGGNVVVKLASAGLVLAGCLALASCNTTSGLRLPSAFNYPEANAYVDCVVGFAKRRALEVRKQGKRIDSSEIRIGAIESCTGVEEVFRSRARADGMPVNKIVDFTVQVRTKAMELAWDEVAKIRLEQYKAEGAIR